MKRISLMFLVVLFSSTAFAQHDHAKHGEQQKQENMVMFKDKKMGNAYEHYLHLKDALVASNQADAKKAADDLQKSLVNVTDGKMVADEAAKVANAASLEDQRKAFSGVSDMMAMLVKGGKLSMGMLYLEYCPMANNNKGAYWLSNEKEIRNPYFGNGMLTCGSVKEMIH
ncbi:MAG TPA: DUF3347 domain-containing protein [Cyclobacteriaceae bacterium]|jgi:hypothetical protein|nr:DUF3347 domain-containing protein [Cyclobacteriaceae bacterium]